MAQSSGMIEIQGWISIATSIDGDQDYDKLPGALDEVKELIKPLNEPGQFFELKAFNFSQILFIGVHSNHDNGYSDEVLDVLIKIGKIAPASFGLVHARWPEHITDYNVYKIYRMARGKVSIEEDTLLSPCNPVIEE
jgi:hypothetical protein